MEKETSVRKQANGKKKVRITSKKRKETRKQARWENKVRIIGKSA
jgi:hypothetical protein